MAVELKTPAAHPTMEHRNPKHNGLDILELNSTPHRDSYIQRLGTETLRALNEHKPMAAIHNNIRGGQGERMGQALVEGQEPQEAFEPARTSISESQRAIRAEWTKWSIWDQNHKEKKETQTRGHFKVNKSESQLKSAKPNSTHALVSKQGSPSTSSS